MACGACGRRYSPAPGSPAPRKASAGQPMSITGQTVPRSALYGGGRRNITPTSSKSAPPVTGDSGEDLNKEKEE